MKKCVIIVGIYPDLCVGTYLQFVVIPPSPLVSPQGYTCGFNSKAGSSLLWWSPQKLPWNLASAKKRALSTRSWPLFLFVCLFWAVLFPSSFVQPKIPFRKMLRKPSPFSPGAEVCGSFGHPRAGHRDNCLRRSSCKQQRQQQQQQRLQVSQVAPPDYCSTKEPWGRGGGAFLTVRLGAGAEETAKHRHPPPQNGSTHDFKPLLNQVYLSLTFYEMKWSLLSSGGLGIVIVEEN